MTTKQRQNLLQYLGYYSGVPDDVYGPQTKKAVEDFQRDYGGIGVDGLAGTETDAALLDAVANGITKQHGSPADTADAAQYLQADGCYHIPRGVDVQLSKNLWAHEIHCQGNGCCQESIISKAMVEMFQAIRDAYGEPIYIAEAGGSGYRCDTHNAEVGGAFASLHKTGNALDLHCNHKDKLLSIVTRLVKDGEIGVYSWGIHVGVWNRGFVNRFTYG